MSKNKEQSEIKLDAWLFKDVGSAVIIRKYLVVTIHNVVCLLQRSFNVSNEKNASVQSMAYSRQGVVAISLKSSCDIRLFHHSTFKHLTDINIFSTAAQKLSKCEEIIKQHKTGELQECLSIAGVQCCNISFSVKDNPSCLIEEVYWSDLFSNSFKIKGFYYLGSAFNTITFVIIKLSG